MIFCEFISKIKQDRDVLTSILRTLLTRGTAAFGILLLNAVLARLLGTKGLGLFILAFTVLICVSTVARFGMDNSLLRFAGTAWGTRDAGRFFGIYKQAIRRSVIHSILLSIGLYFSAPWVSYLFSAPEAQKIIKIIALALTPYTTMHIFAALLKSVRWSSISAFFENGGLSLTTALLVLLFFFTTQHMDIVTASWILTGTAFGLSIFSGYLLLHRTKKFRRSVTKVTEEPNLMSANLTFMLTAIAALSIQWLPSLILGIIGTAEDVGLFNTAQRVAVLISFILTVANSVISSRIATLYKQGKQKELEAIAVRMTLYMTLVALPPAVLFILLPNQILGLFGTEFQDASPHLIVLALAQLMNVCIGSVGLLLNMTGHEKIMRNIVFSMGIFTVFICLILTPEIGIWGATLSTCVAIVGQNIIAARYVYRKLGIRTMPSLLIATGKIFKS